VWSCPLPVLPEHGEVGSVIRSTGKQDRPSLRIVVVSPSPDPAPGRPRIGCDAVRGGAVRRRRAAIRTCGIGWVAMLDVNAAGNLVEVEVFARTNARWRDSGGLGAPPGRESRLGWTLSRQSNQYKGILAAFKVTTGENMLGNALQKSATIASEFSARRFQSRDNRFCPEKGSVRAEDEVGSSYRCCFC